MGKYIDAEKLKEYLTDRYEVCPINDDERHGRHCAIIEIQNFITSLQQEQPEVDLEKFTETIKTFQERYKHPEIVSIKGAMAFMARMFYMHPNVAREWYDNLPKATMD